MSSQEPTKSDPDNRLTVSQDPGDRSSPGHPALPHTLPTIPGYELTELIAQGGMGVVYKGVQLGLNRPAAVKLMHGWIRNESSARVRFEIEAEAVARLHHPHVVAVYEFGEHNGVPFLAMEYLDGGSLADKIRRDGRHDSRAAATLLAAIAEAVAAAHAKGIVHRDLKPSNVMLTAAGVPKVTDFGMARIGDGELTTTGMMIGTPNYMSPEQASGRVRDIGTAADVWALGCILYRLLAGRLPFEADTATTMFQKVLTREPPALRGVALDLPRDLETICLKCLEKEPRNRYPTADALASDLRAFLDGRPISARPITVVERAWKWAKRYPGRATAVAVGLLAAVAIGITAIQVRSALVTGRRTERAEAAADALTTAESAAVPALVDSMSDLRELARPRLHELAHSPVDTKPGLHARYALLADEPHRLADLAAYAPACRSDELALFTRLPPAVATELAPTLWAALDDPKTDPAKRLRYAAVLAAAAPTDPRWKAHAPAVAEQLVLLNPLEAEAFVRALTPVRNDLVPELRTRYAAAKTRVEYSERVGPEVLAEFGRYELTAQILARWTADRPAPLADLAVLAADRHHPLFAEALTTHKAELVPLFRAELAHRPFRLWEEGVDGRAPFDAPVQIVAGGAVEQVLTAPNGLIEESVRRRANAAAALFALGHADEVWPLLVHSPDPGVRCQLIRRLAAVGADPAVLVARYRAERDLSAKRALILAVGDIPIDRLPAKFREQLVPEFLDEYARHPDAGLHAAIGWLLRRQWNEEDAVRRIDDALTEAAGRRAKEARKQPGAAAAPVLPKGCDCGWFVNAEGQTFATIRGPVTTPLGSSISETGRVSVRETARRESIPHSFAVATREVTTAEFRRFRENHKKNPFNEDPACPVVTLTWHDATAYCNWLSEQDGIPEDQWCYDIDEQGGVTIRENRLALRGYRLPTELEWECACRAGCITTRHFGRGGDLFGRYAWMDKSSGRKSHPGGLLRPNDWGLFDTLGNVWEWCEDAAILDEPGRTVGDYWGTAAQDRRVYRGGSFFDDAQSVRIANRNSYRPADAYYSIGLRPVRSIP